MSMSIQAKIVSVALIGLVLAGGLSSITAGMLVCIGNGTAHDCCGSAKSTHPSRGGQSDVRVAATDCDCCIAVDALPSVAGACAYKASLDLAAGPVHFRNVVLPSRPHFPCVLRGDRSDERLTSLRSVVLLV